MHLRAFKSTFTASRSVVDTNWIPPFGKPSFSAAAAMISVSFLFELKASEPPRKMIVLPDFIHTPAASTVTFGLAS